MAYLRVKPLSSGLAVSATTRIIPFPDHGGPSYAIPKYDDILNRTLDPIESRKWIFPFDVTRLGPRAADSYFDEGAIQSSRPASVTSNNFLNGKWRRINFWQYTRPGKSDQPYFYFDVLC